jgi:hypothetical protein
MLVGDILTLFVTNVTSRGELLDTNEGKIN